MQLLQVNKSSFYSIQGFADNIFVFCVSLKLKFILFLLTLRPFESLGVSIYVKG